MQTASVPSSEGYASRSVLLLLLLLLPPPPPPPPPPPETDVQILTPRRCSGRPATGTRIGRRSSTHRR